MNTYEQRGTLDRLIIATMQNGCLTETGKEILNETRNPFCKIVGDRKMSTSENNYGK